MEKQKNYIPVKNYALNKGITVQAVYKKIKSKKIFHKKIGTYNLVSD